ncbi:DUF11 domain-containing protein [Modestobacter sp. I12A-02628]|uniref:DUF11 domain-containing protein n=1 Tax=Goekera deserti TaxID=2497753 RepID=A0A7K3WJI1_9ACTN|nr:DUF11 domain-containing protein [Goekera deserti]MPQ99985.1 DUF11 domain-containing protein [Goekera deserti]NDI49764.1 DUF11 domain-containing protein [Goekera deserti]NEL56614.1 DUF11 domain-containing protein [Goekera deserti]
MVSSRRRTAGRAGQALRRIAAATGVAAVVGALLVTGPVPQAAAVQSPAACNSTVALRTGGFELPVLKDNSYSFVPEAQVPGWSTTASDKRIEIWRAPFQGVPAASGSQFAELNATQTSTLFQDVATTPGQSLRWELQHRGRAGTDVMAVHIAAPTAALAPTNQQGPLISDGKNAWGTYSGLYTVPSGQTTTRFSFKAVSTATGDPTVGNFLDSISFGTGACLMSTTTVTTRSGAAGANVGEILTYSVATANGGGNPAKNTVVVDTLPAGVEFVPGSIRAITASATQARTDAAGDDQGEYDAATRTVRVRVGLNATATSGGVVRPEDARSISYQVRVTEALSATTVRNDARVEYTDDLAGGAATSVSTEVATPIAAAADLAVTVARTTAPPVAGRPVEYTATIRNRGPSPEPAARLVIDLPRWADGTTPGLTGVTAATTGGGSCTVATLTVTCDHGALAPGDQATVTVGGEVRPDTLPATPYRFLAAASGTAYDHVPDDNAMSVADAVTTSADLAVDLLADRTAGTAGGPVTYTATVTNAGPSTAREVVLTDPLGDGVTVTSATVTSGSGSCTTDASTTTVRCALGDLARGASATVEVRVTLSSSGSGAIGNSVSVTSATPDPVGADNQDEVTGTGEVLADLAVDLVIPVTEAYPGDTVPFTVHIDNLGTSDAVNVSLQTVLPPGFRVTALTGITCTAQAGCRIARIPGGGRATITGQALVLADAPAGTTMVRARVVSPTPDGTAGNDVDEFAFTVRLEADLSVTQTIVNPDDVGGPVVAGGKVHAVFTVSNPGRTRAEGVVVRQTIPAGQLMPVLTPQAGRCDVEGDTVATALGPQSVDGAVVVCSLDVLARGATWSVEFDSVLRTSFKDDTWSRTRLLTSSTADPVTGNNIDTASIPAVRRSDVQVTKTTSTPMVVQTDPVRFQVQVTNAGPSDSRDVLVRETPRPGVLIDSATPSEGVYAPANGAWRIPYLAVGRTVTLDVVGTAQSSTDVVNDAVFLSAEDTGLDPANDTGSSTVDVTPADRSLAITATATVTPAAHQDAVRVTDAIAFTYLVINTGNVAMSDVAVRGTLATGGVTCPSTTLAAGASMTCAGNGSYRVTQSDVDDGQAVEGAAFASGVPQGSTAPLEFGPASDPVPIDPLAAGRLATVQLADWDDADGDDALDAGETIVWTVVVTNTGELTLRDLTVDLPEAAGITCAATELAPGAQTTCTAATYTVTAADVLAGQRTAGSTAAARDPRGGPVVRSAAASSMSPGSPVPALGVVVDGRVDPASRQDAALPGDTLHWEYTVTNLGNVRVTGISVDDPEGGAVTCDDLAIDPGAVTRCVGAARHPVTEDDLLTGAVTNEAAATGTSVVGGALVRSAPGRDAVGMAALVRALTLTTTATVTPAANQGGVRVGDSVRHAYEVTNTGNVTMRDVGVADVLVAGQPAEHATCSRAVLAPGDTASCTAGATRRVTQADVDAGQPVTHSATVSGIPAGSTTPGTFGPVAAPVPLAAASGALLAKKVANWTDTGVPGALDAGETIVWSVVVTNTGELTVDDLLVDDVTAPAMTCLQRTLLPTEATTCTAGGYTVTGGDVGGTKTNTATVRGTDRRGAVVTSNASTTETPSVSSPELAVTVAGVVDPVARQSAAAPGDTVQWTYRVTNVGNVRVTGVGVDDPDAGVVTCSAPDLDPGASATCTGGTPRTVSEADLFAGSVTNAALATGTGPGAVPLSSPSASARVGVAAVVRELTIATTATATRAGAPVTGGVRVGDHVAYTHLVTNAGNVAMGDLEVDDVRGGAVSCPSGPLAVGSTVTCSVAAAYVVTQLDFDLGVPVTDSATVSGTTAAGPERTSFGPSSAPVPVAAGTTGLTAVKTAARTGTPAGAALAAGQTIRWSVLVTNTGDLTLSDVYVSDPLALSMTCDTTTVLPGGTARCAAPDYLVTADDRARGVKQNTAVASAVGPRDAVRVSAAPSSTTTPSAPSGALALEVTGTVVATGLPDGADVGDAIRWTYAVVNTGNVPVSRIGVDDPDAGTVTCRATLLEPGAATSCTGAASTYVTEGDVLTGRVVNAAAAGGTAVAGGAPVAVATDSATVVTAAARPRITVRTRFELATSAAAVLPPAPVPAAPGAPQLAAGQALSSVQVGDRVRVLYRVVNDGNVTLTGVRIDDLYGPVTCAGTVLAPGAATECQADQVHVVTPEDLAAGGLVNAATAYGAPPSVLARPVVSSADSATLTVARRTSVDDPGGSGDPTSPTPVGGPPPPGGPGAGPGAGGPASRPGSVTASGGSGLTEGLARTGAELLGGTAVAALLLVGGALLWRAGRRRGVRTD